MRLTLRLSLALVAICLVLPQVTEASPAALAPSDFASVLVAKDVQALEARLPAKAKAKSKGGSKSRKASKPVKQKKVFCDRFRQACIDATMDGKTEFGNYTIAYSCKRYGQKRGSQYTFGCRLNDEDFTAKALSRVAGRKANVQDGATVYVTMSDTKTIIDVQTSVVPTTVATSTATSTSVSLVQETSIATVAEVGSDLFPVVTYKVLPGPNPSRRRRASDDDESICPAYAAACAKECKRVKSSPKYQRCKQNATDAKQYSLSCVCKNGKTETQHALANIGQEDAQPVGTTTVTIASTATLVVPSTTVTAVPVTAQVTMVTSTPTTTTVASTTVFAVGPTGYFRMARSDQPASQGYVALDGNGLSRRQQSPSYRVTDDVTKAVRVIMTRDPASGWFKFIELVSGMAFGAEGVVSSPVVFAENTPAYVQLNSQTDKDAVPAPASGQGSISGNSYETWITNELRIPENGAATEPVEIFGAYVNPDGSKYVGKASYAYDGALVMIADASAYVFNSPGFFLRLFYQPEPWVA